MRSSTRASRTRREVLEYLGESAQTTPEEAERVAGITLDTGALIALERRTGRMPKIWAAAVAARTDPHNLLTGHRPSSVYDDRVPDFMPTRRRDRRRPGPSRSDRTPFETPTRRKGSARAR